VLLCGPVGLVLRVLPLSLALAGCHLLFPLDGFEAADGGTDGGADAGNPRSCAGAFICDGFESGTSSWNETVTQHGGDVAVDTAQAHSGTHSLHTLASLDTAGNESYALLRDDKSVPILFYARVFAYLPAPAPGGAYAIIAAQENTGGYRGTSLGFQNGQLMVVNWTTPPDTDTVQVANGTFPTGTWVCLEWMLDSTQHETRVWQNGAEVTELHVTGLTTPAYEWFRLGLDVGGMPNTTYQLWLDDLYVGTQPVGCDR
jgi:hypothetical protein